MEVISGRPARARDDCMPETMEAQLNAYVQYKMLHRVHRHNDSNITAAFHSGAATA